MDEGCKGETQNASHGRYCVIVKVKQFRDILKVYDITYPIAYYLADT